MNKLKTVIKMLFFPRPPVVLICAPIAAALLVYTFICGREDTPIGYFSYLFSAYALTTVSVRIPTAIKYFSQLMHRNEAAHRFLTDIPFRMRVSMYISLGINTVYAAIKLFTGFYYGSVWFMTMAVYYIMLAVIRFLLLKHISGNAVGADYTAELKRYRGCGGILLGMNVVLAGIATLVVIENKSTNYSGNLIYVMAAYTFYTTISSIVNIVKFRKLKSPVMSAAKAVSLVAALVSMLSLETAMLTQFGNEDEIFRLIITAITGAAICLTVLGIAVYMIVSSTVKLNIRQKTEELDEN